MYNINTLNIFYDEIITIANGISTLPTETYSFLYDPRFMSENVIEWIKNKKDETIYQADLYYREILGSVDLMTRGFDNMMYICDSGDIEDDFEAGEFDYYAGFLNNDCPILYHQSPNIFVFPNRAVFYTPLYQIEVSSIKKGIDIYESITPIRNIFFIKDKRSRKQAIKDMLFNSDRPKITINYDL